MSQLQIVKGPYRLHVGANGHKTYGIRLRHVEDPGPGYSREYEINDYTIALPGSYGRYGTLLGFTPEQWKELVDNVAAMAAAQVV